MKLKNKKTGEIADLSEGFIRDTYNGEMIQIKPVAISNKQVYVYGSLAELNEEWEDYEEPDGWWFICQKSNAYEPHATNLTLRNSEADREIGNYFHYKEDAEEALEKLKAFKRLKDKGFRFVGRSIKDLTITYSFDNYDKPDISQMNKDLDLLFGGEE